MKKITLITLLLLLVSGCSSNDLNSKKMPTSGDSSDKPSLSTEEKTVSSSSNITLKNFEESNKLAELINLDDLSVTTLTNNSDKRILLFTRDNQKLYKSIFIKSTQLLKVIDLQNNETNLFSGNI